VIHDIVEKNPRFKNTLGSVTFPANTVIAWKDVWVTIRNVATSGTRLSPDYFMCTQQSRAILAKVSDKPGQFVEWIRETDSTRQTPAAGIYYFNIDYFDEKTNDIGLTGQQFTWKEGKVLDAEGSQVFFRAGLGDLTTLVATDASTALPVNFVAFNQSTGGFMNLLSPAAQLTLAFSNDTPLQPDIDFWYQRNQTSVVCQTTKGGTELINVPPNVGFNITDQDGYILRPGKDYINYGNNNFIQLASWSPAGSTLYCNATIKLNPYTNSGTNPENILQFGLTGNETLAPGQTYVHTTSGDYSNLTVNSDGTATLPVLLQPGEYCHWNVRIEMPQIRARAKKWEMNSLIIVDPNTIKYKQPPAPRPGEPLPPSVQINVGEPLLVNGDEQYFLPGLLLAIGDQVIVGDQSAIIVSPTVTETYEVFGSKENINFTLEVKANDLQTSSDLSEMIKQQLLVFGRTAAETDGLTIFEVTRDFVGEARDASATAPKYVYTISVTASADWKVYVPLITRLVRFEINETMTTPAYQGNKLQMANRMTALGQTMFIPSYK
jgi:hypothetical protein